MATIRKRNQRWQAQVRIKGTPALSKSFPTKAEARHWARRAEAHTHAPTEKPALNVLDSITLEDLLERYLLEVTAKKRGHVRENFAVKALKRHAIAKTTLSMLNEAMVAKYRDTRLIKIKPSTINRELAIFRHALSLAAKEWGIPVTLNPFATVTKPRVNDARSRRLENGEQAMLLEACKKSRNPDILNMVEFALETGMRRSEILRITEAHVSWGTHTLNITLTKNGYPRTIPLTPKAEAILKKCLSAQWSQTVPLFNSTDNALRIAWRKVIKRTVLQNFRFHDLRHEAISRFFELGLSIPEVALISGHRDYKMLARYTHLRPETVAAKIAMLTQARDDRAE